MAWPDMGALATDDGLARAAALLRRYHEAVADFDVPADAERQFPDMAPDGEPFVGGEGRIVCHNDCAAWNLVMGDDRWAFIDWDVAGPRPRIWDVAYAIRGMVLVDPDSDITRRVAVFSDAYGLDDVERRRLPEVVVARIESSIGLMRRHAEAGEEPWATMWAGDHRTAWESTLALARRVL
jgi:Ser/Thr protein kinase RdoA (MazF antagonist)